MKKLKREKDGDVFEINLSKDKFAYGIILNKKKLFYSFYDNKGKKIKTINELDTVNILFTIMVSNVDDSKTKWNIIGNSSELTNKITEPTFVRKDVLSKRFYIYKDDANDSDQISLKEARKYEIAAVWYPSHIEDRLIDTFEGRENRWLEDIWNI